MGGHVPAACWRSSGMCSAGGSWELLCLCLHPCQWGLGWLPFLWGRRRKEQSYGVKLFITEAANCCDMCRATGFLFYFLLLGITVERCPNPPLAWSWCLVGRRPQAAGLPAMSTAREHWETLSAWLLWAGLTAGLLHGCTVCSSSHPWAVSVQLPGSAHTPAPPALPGGWGEMPRRCGFVGVMIALLIQILETNKQKTNPKQRQRHTANIQAVTGWMSKDLCCVTFSDGCACAVCRKPHICVWTPIRHWSSSCRQAVRVLLFLFHVPVVLGLLTHKSAWESWNLSRPKKCSAARISWRIPQLSWWRAVSVGQCSRGQAAKSPGICWSETTQI